MSVDEVYRWHRGALSPAPASAGSRGTTADTLAAADSWLVTDGAALAVGLHRERFFAALARTGSDVAEAALFWEAAIARVPRTGDWFPRVELSAGGAEPELRFRLRNAPARTRSVAVVTFMGADPRTTPRIKGPDLARMQRVRQGVTFPGAGEAIILTPEGYVIEGAYSGLLWWRGEILCGPPADFDRIDSVTVRSLLTLARALGVETYEEAVTPAELDGTELWALNALHGPRIVTGWAEGPNLAERPGRLGVWRSRLAALRRNL